MDIWFKTDSTFLTLPVLPSSFEVTGSMNNTSVTIEDLGEVNLKGKTNGYFTEINRCVDFTDNNVILLHCK